jgi:copper(I)-binding protein
LSLRLCALLIAGAIAWTVFAGEPGKGGLVVSNAWSRPTPAGMGMGVGYFTVTNRGSRTDTLIHASTPAAAGVEFHESLLVDGMARMRPREAIPVPAGGTVQLQPGGLHLMLVGLKAPLAAGSKVPLTLTFRGAGTIQVELAVGAPPAP